MKFDNWRFARSQLEKTKTENMNIRRLIWAVIAGLAILFVVVGTVLDSINGDKIYRALQDTSQIKRIEMTVMLGSIPDGHQHISLQNDSAFKLLNQEFKHLEKFKPEGTRDNSVYTLMAAFPPDRKSTRLNSSHQCLSRMPSSA